MLNEVLKHASVAWAMIHVVFLFIMLFRPRYSKKMSILIAGTGMGILMVLNFAGLALLGFETMGKLFLLTCTVPSFLFLYILSKDRKFRFLLTFCLADTTSFWVMVVTNLLDYYVGGGRSVLLFISRLLAFPLLEYFAYRYLRKPYLELQDEVKRGWGIFAGTTMLYYLLLGIVSQYPTNIVNRPDDVLVCVLILVLMFFTYGTMFYALYRQQQLHRKQQSELRLQEQKNLLEAKLENQQSIRRMKHDMKGYTVMLSGLLAAGKTEEALDYLEQVKTKMDSLLGQFCANPYINGIFAHYAQKFQELGAEYKTDVLIGGEDLPYMALCQILSNGLENAYYALKELDGQEREVLVQMRYKKEYLTIRIQNSCQKDLLVEKGTIPASKKPGPDHGFGLITIREAANELGGDMMCYAKEGRFVLEVMVRMSEWGKLEKRYEGCQSKQ